MRRLSSLFILVCLLTGLLAIPASADSAASRMDIRATINAEGSCVVSMTATLRLEAAQSQLYFPLPAGAQNITMNGARVSTNKTDSATLVDISRISQNSTGEYALTFDFTIPEAVKVSEEKLGGKYPLVLTLPLLCGFEHPVENLSFIITMPGKLVTEDPIFTSIYRQASIASDLECLVDGNQIIGSSKTALHDHDGVTMTMVVSEKMFPTVSTYVREGNPELIYIIGFAVAAFLYWLLFLRTAPLRRMHASTAPEGITAGELGCRLTHCGGDLTMMVFSWAQMGYILIHLDGNGRVMLHKQMDMGNERNPFENKIFRSLFGSRRMVDATGNTYAKLCRKVAGIVPSAQGVRRLSSGHMRVFRLLACVSQLMCGVCVAMNFKVSMTLQIVFAVILALFGMVSAWLIQDIAHRDHLRGKTAVYIGFVCILIWIGLGLLCGQIWIPLGCVIGEFVVGYFASYGGRRSDLERTDACQILGLRSYLKRLQSSDLTRLMNNDPEYFFNMAPYALAMGIITPFSRRFGRRMLPQCPYIVSRISGKRTAEEWGSLMEDVADLMDMRARQLEIEKWLTPPKFEFQRPAPPRKQPPKKAPQKKRPASGKKAAPKSSTQPKPRKKPQK